MHQAGGDLPAELAAVDRVLASIVFGCGTEDTFPFPARKADGYLQPVARKILGGAADRIPSHLYLIERIDEDRALILIDARGDSSTCPKKRIELSVARYRFEKPINNILRSIGDCSLIFSLRLR